MLVGMGVGASLCFTYGIVPSLLYNLLPNGGDYHPYTVDHIVSGTVLLVGTALAFWLLREKLAGERAINLDTDWFYRRPLAYAVALLVDAVRSAGETATTVRRALVGRAWSFTQHPPAALSGGGGPHPEDDDPYRFRAPIGATVFWVVVYFVLVAIVAISMA